MGVPVQFIVPTMDDALSRRFRDIQEPNLRQIGPTDYRVAYEPAPECTCPILGKMISAYKQAASQMEDGLIIWVHHDTMIDDHVRCRQLLQWIWDKEIAVAGPRECDGVYRGNQQGIFYVNSHFMVMRKSLTDHWYEVDRWIDNGWVVGGSEYVLQGMEFYWKVIWSARGNPWYLDVMKREPPIGKATMLLDHKGDPFASHLWHSAAWTRNSAKWKTYEGLSYDEIEEWCEEWLREYGNKVDRQHDQSGSAAALRSLV